MDDLRLCLDAGTYIESKDDVRLAIPALYLDIICHSFAVHRSAVAWVVYRRGTHRPIAELPMNGLDVNVPSAVGHSGWELR